MDPQCNLYVLVGVPGSGKSTWISNQVWAKDCAYISTDKFVDEHARLTGKTYSEVFDLVMTSAVSMMMDEVISAKKAGKDIIWDQTSTTRKSRKRKIISLQEYYKIAVVFSTPDKTELERRLASRTGKVIPQDIIDKMIPDLETEPPSLEEGFDEVWYA